MKWDCICESSSGDNDDENDGCSSSVNNRTASVRSYCIVTTSLKMYHILCFRPFSLSLSLGFVAVDSWYRAKWVCAHVVYAFNRHTMHTIWLGRKNKTLWTTISHIPLVASCLCVLPSFRHIRIETESKTFTIITIANSQIYGLLWFFSLIPHHIIKCSLIEKIMSVLHIRFFFLHSPWKTMIRILDKQIAKVFLTAVTILYQHLGIKVFVFTVDLV